MFCLINVREKKMSSCVLIPVAFTTDRPTDMRVPHLLLVFFFEENKKRKAGKACVCLCVCVRVQRGGPERVGWKERCLCVCVCV